MEYPIFTNFASHNYDFVLIFNDDSLPFNKDIILQVVQAKYPVDMFTKHISTYGYGIAKNSLAKIKLTLHSMVDKGYEKNLKFFIDFEYKRARRKGAIIFCFISKSYIS